MQYYVWRVLASNPIYVSSSMIYGLIFIVLFNIPFPGGVAVLGLTPTSQPYFDNVMCPSNAASVSDCSFDVPPTSPRCSESSSAAGVRCIQGM